MDKDWNYIAKLERAISQKYGKETVAGFNSDWTLEKEKEYLRQVDKLKEKDLKYQAQDEKVKVDGFLVSKKLLNRESNRTCPICKIYSFVMKDDIYMAKYECCLKCYIEYVEDREERWNSGWRPNTGEK